MFGAPRLSLPTAILGLLAATGTVLTPGCSERTHGATPPSSSAPGRPVLETGPRGTGPGPALIAGMPTCADVSGRASDWLEATLEGGEWLTPGTYATYFEIQPNLDLQHFLNWSASSAIMVHAVVVRGGAAANLYSYGDAPFPAKDSHTQLQSPVKASGQPFEISHITFCYTLATKNTED